MLFLLTTLKNQFLARPSVAFNNKDIKNKKNNIENPPLRPSMF